MAQVAVDDRNAIGRAWDRVRTTTASVPRRLRGLGDGLSLDRALALVAVLLLPAGVTAIVLGWAGAARTPFLFEQVPYLISGGLLGVGLLTAGGLLYLATWVARSAQLAGERDDALRNVLTEVRDELRSLRTEGGAGAPALSVVPPMFERPDAVGAPLALDPGAAATQAIPVLKPFVATPSGTMYHRPECAVVNARDDLRRVSEEDGLRPCALCEPTA